MKPNVESQRHLCVQQLKSLDKIISIDVFRYFDLSQKLATSDHESYSFSVLGTSILKKLSLSLSIYSSFFRTHLFFILLLTLPKLSFSLCQSSYVIKTHIVIFKRCNEALPTQYFLDE